MLLINLVSVIIAVVVGFEAAGYGWGWFTAVILVFVLDLLLQLLWKIGFGKTNLED